MIENNTTPNSPYQLSDSTTHSAEQSERKVPEEVKEVPRADDIQLEMRPSHQPLEEFVKSDLLCPIQEGIMSVPILLQRAPSTAIDLDSLLKFRAQRPVLVNPFDNLPLDEKIGITFDRAKYDAIKHALSHLSAADKMRLTPTDQMKLEAILADERLNEICGALGESSKTLNVIDLTKIPNSSLIPRHPACARICRQVVTNLTYVGPNLMAYAAVAYRFMPAAIMLDIAAMLGYNTILATATHESDLYYNLRSFATSGVIAAFATSSAATFATIGLPTVIAMHASLEIRPVRNAMQSVARNVSSLVRNTCSFFHNRLSGQNHPSAGNESLIPVHQRSP